MAINGLMLVFFSIALLSVPGVIFNNLNNTGLIVNQSLSCPGYPDVTCQGSVNAGCQASSTYCTLSGQTISFLSLTSPFTALAQGNLWGFLFDLGTVQPISNSNPWQNAGLSANYYVQATCEFQYQGNLISVIRSCTQIDSQANNLTSANTISWSSPPNLGNGSSVHLYNLINNAYSTYHAPQLRRSLCSGFFAFYSTGLSNAGTLLSAYSPCQYFQTIDSTGHIAHHGSTGNTTNYWYFWFNLNGTSYKNGASGCFFNNNCSNGTVYHFPVTVQPVNWDAWECTHQSQSPNGYGASANLGSGVTDPLAIPPITPECQNLYNSLLHYGASIINSGGFVVPISFWWLGGIALFVLGTGINFQLTGSIFGTGGGIGAGSNRQGTKFAQVFGLGLVIFLPLYSEFSFWFTSGQMPNGFDGPLGIISLLITALFFGGLIFWATNS